MNRYEEAVKRVLEEFCREYTGRDAGWQVDIWRHPTTGSVRSAVVVPEFVQLHRGQRINIVHDYLRAHLSPDEFGHLSLAIPLTPDEYEHTDWKPEEVELVAIPR